MSQIETEVFDAFLAEARASALIPDQLSAALEAALSGEKAPTSGALKVLICEKLGTNNDAKG